MRSFSPGVAPLRIPLTQLLFAFEGRIPRSTWWLASLVNSVGFEVESYLFSLSRDPTSGVAPLWGVILLLPMLAGIWIGMALNAKRWHDMGQPAWFSLFTLVPFLGALTLIWYGFIKGDVQSNPYGADPLARVASVDAVRPEHGRSGFA